MDQVQLLAASSAIANAVGDLSIPVQLLGSQGFRAIYERPLDSVDAARALLVREDVDEPAKLVIAYAMQRLPLDAFMTLVTAAVTAVEQRRLTPLVLEVLAFPSFDWGGHLVDHYARPDVRRVVEYIVAMAEVAPAKKAYIREDVLTGRAQANRAEYRELLGFPDAAQPR